MRHHIKGTLTPLQMRSAPQRQRPRADVEGPAAAAARAGDAAVVVVAAGTARAARRYSRRNRGAADHIGRITVPRVQACSSPFLPAHDCVSCCAQSLMILCTLLQRCKRLTISY